MFRPLKSIGQNKFTLPSDYNRDDESHTIPRHIKCYGDHIAETIIEVAKAHELRKEILRHPDWQFCVVRVWADKKTFRRCQYEWLARMIAEPSATEIEL